MGWRLKTSPLNTPQLGCLLTRQQRLLLVLPWGVIQPTLKVQKWWIGQNRASIGKCYRCKGKSWPNKSQPRCRTIQSRYNSQSGFLHILQWLEFKQGISTKAWKLPSTLRKAPKTPIVHLKLKPVFNTLFEPYKRTNNPKWTANVKRELSYDGNGLSNIFFLFATRCHQKSNCFCLLKLFFSFHLTKRLLKGLKLKIWKDLWTKFRVFLAELTYLKKKINSKFTIMKNKYFENFFTASH